MTDLRVEEAARDGGWSRLGDGGSCPSAPNGLRVSFSKLQLLCLNPSINTKDCSTNNTSHSDEFFFLGWLRENA